MAGFAEAYRAWLEAMSAKPETMLDLQGRYMQEQMRLWMSSMQPGNGGGAGAVADKRFSAPEWNELPVFRYFRDSYLLTSRMMMQAVEEATLDAPTKQRMRFFMRQYLDAAAPSNYLMTNPEALRAAMESRGETLREGMQNLLADMEKGRISMTDESAFEVGKNIAVTPGAVVYENDLIQLIQYRPITAKVHERPLVMVPPCINKFYIMDLSPRTAGALRRRAGPHGFHDVVAQREEGAGAPHVGRLSRSPHRRPRGSPAHRQDAEGEHARLLHRRHAGRIGARGPGKEGAQAGREPDAAHHAPRVLRSRRHPRLHRRELRGQAREAAREGRHRSGAGARRGVLEPARQRLVWSYVVTIT